MRGQGSGVRGQGTGFVRLSTLCSLLFAVSPAGAQSFEPPIPTERVLVLLDRSGNVRFTLSGYYASWENPFRISVSTFSNLLNRTVSRDLQLNADTPASPLFEGTYVLGRRWGVGFWYNPIRGERLRTTVQVAEKFIPLDLERDTDLMDFHVMYFAPKGLSVQLGYYREHGTITNNDPLSLSSQDYTLNSWNIWLTQRLDVLARNGLVSPRLDAQLVPFVSVGYTPASSMNHAVSVLTGVAVTFRERLSLSGSVWWFDLSDTATRITGGLVLQY